MVLLFFIYFLFFHNAYFWNPSELRVIVYPFISLGEQIATEYRKISNLIICFITKCNFHKLLYISPIDISLFFFFFFLFFLIGFGKKSLDVCCSGRGGSFERTDQGTNGEKQPTWIREHYFANISQSRYIIETKPATTTASTSHNFLTSTGQHVFSAYEDDNICSNNDNNAFWTNVTLSNFRCHLYHHHYNYYFYHHHYHKQHRFL